MATSAARSSTDNTTTPERVKRTRNRIPQSCQPCRKRKLKVRNSVRKRLTFKCDRQHPACQNCIKRGDQESCVYVEPPEDEKTRALRARLEELEAQVREISTSLMAAETAEQADPTEEPDMAMIEQFTKLYIQPKHDGVVCYIPSKRRGISTGYSEIFKTHKAHYKDACELQKTNRQLLADDFPMTDFPFYVITSNYHLEARLPDQPLGDKLVTRYFECCNSVFNIIDLDIYRDQY